MPIVFGCQCGKKLQARDEHAGKSVRCPSCKQVVKIPAATGTKTPTAPPRPANRPPSGIVKPASGIRKAPTRPPSAARRPAPTPTAFRKPTSGVMRKPLTRPPQPISKPLAAKPKKTAPKKKKYICPACAEEVSPDDVVCINCGNKLDANFGDKEKVLEWYQKPIVKQIFYFIVLIIIIFLVYQFIIKAPKNEYASAIEEPAKETPALLC
ncbi:hypothetical protein ACFL5I_00145 [Planctomycetota bacterium]